MISNSIKVFLLILLVILIVYLYKKFVPIVKIGLGYAAKTACSGVFIANRTLKSIQQNEIANSAASISKISINKQQKSATAKFLWLQRKAIYREGLGATLISEAAESTLKNITRITNTESEQRTILMSKDIKNYTNEASNFNCQLLKQAFTYAFDEPQKDNPRNTRAAIIVYKGNIIKEQYANGFNENTPLRGWSLTKSVMHALVGILVKQQKLDINAPIAIPQWKSNPSDERNKITLNHLLQMNSGLDFIEKYSIFSTVNTMLWLKADASKFAAAQKLLHQPGTHWNYSSGNTNIISKIIRDQFPNYQDYLNFPYQYLFEPLGMHSAQMEADASGTYVGSSFMYATARDWTKFGLLYLNNGIHKCKQILTEDWVAYASKRNKVSNHGTYAAHFWKNAIEPTPDMESNKYWPGLPDDMFYANGYEGQNIVIIPSKETVIVRLGQTKDRHNWDVGKFVELVLKALPAS